DNPSILIRDLPWIVSAGCPTLQTAHALRRFAKPSNLMAHAPHFLDGSRLAFRPFVELQFLVNGLAAVQPPERATHGKVRVLVVDAEPKAGAFGGFADAIVADRVLVIADNFLAGPQSVRNLDDVIGLGVEIHHDLV